MTNYIAETKNAANNFKSEDIRKGASSMVDDAESFINGAKKNSGEMVSKGAKFLKEEGEKDIRMATNFFKEHPIKGALYTIGIGALLNYFLSPRK